ncbi:MAG: hypothetical protein NNA22_05705 [Nitrospira sp.]|nr:hypothetical protein [Nitrospira sp.]
MGCGGKSRTIDTLWREIKEGWSWFPVSVPCSIVSIPAFPPDAISQAVDQLTHVRSVKSFVAANHEVHDPLKDDVPVPVSEEGGGGENRAGSCHRLGQSRRKRFSAPGHV